MSDQERNYINLMLFNFLGFSVALWAVFVPWYVGIRPVGSLLDFLCVFMAGVNGGLFVMNLINYRFERRKRIIITSGIIKMLDFLVNDIKHKKGKKHG